MLNYGILTQKSDDIASSNMPPCMTMPVIPLQWRGLATEGIRLWRRWSMVASKRNWQPVIFNGYL